MATFFSANQYEDAFWSDRISRWELPHPYKERPDARHGFTRVISNERGHLLPDIRRTTRNPWGNFVGTWDLPKKLPGPRVFVNTARAFDPHDKLVREYYKLEPHINGMIKNGRRNLRHEDAGGPKVKKPTRLGSLSPSHKESCKDLEPFTSRSPETPPLDPAKDDYRDDTCPGRTCLEAAEELAASPDQLQRESGGRRSGGRGGSGTPPSGRSPMLQSPSQTSRSPAAADHLFKGGCGLDQPVLDRRAPSPQTGDAKAICDAIPPNLMDDATRPASPMKIPSPDRADAPAFVFADDELCVDRQPMKTHQRGGSGPPAASPSAAALSPAAARRLDKCRVSPGDPPIQPPLRLECKRFHAPRCRPEVVECARMYDEFTQPPTETCEPYLTKPMRLPPLRTDTDNVDTDRTVFAI